MANKLKVTVVSGSGLVAKNKGKTSSPYCEVTIFDDHSEKVGSPLCTKVRKNDLNPDWNETLTLYAENGSFGMLKTAPKETFTMTINVWDKHMFRRDKFMGRCTVHFNAQLVSSTGVTEGWFNLRPIKSSERVTGKVNVRVQYGSLKASVGGTAEASPGGDDDEVIGSPPVAPGLSGAAQDPELKRSLVSSGNHFIVVDEDVDDDFDRLREGPASTGLVKFKKSSVSLRNKNLQAENTSSSKMEPAKADVKVTGGKWMYEARLESNGQMEVGWCTTNFDPNKPSTQDGHSWTYNGSNQRKSHKGEAAGQYGEYWRSGDVIGCMLDLDEKVITFSRNGTDLGCAFSPAEFPFLKSAFTPFLSLARGMRVTLNFGAEPFRYPVPKFNGLHCFLSDDEIQTLARLFESYKQLDADDEDAADDDVMLDRGIDQYAKDLGITSDEDPGFLIVAYKLNFEVPFEVSRDAWLNGWTANACSTTAQMKAKMNEWKAAILGNDDLFKDFYSFLFDYLKGDKRILDYEMEAKIVWGILLKPRKWKFYDQWIEYCDESGTKAVNKDEWTLLLKFSKQFVQDFSSWDEGDSPWPLKLDDFIYWLQDKGLA